MPALEVTQPTTDAYAILPHSRDAPESKAEVRRLATGWLMAGATSDCAGMAERTRTILYLVYISSFVHVQNPR